jgi:ribose transport system substrate-binding protein
MTDIVNSVACNSKIRRSNMRNKFFVLLAAVLLLVPLTLAVTAGGRRGEEMAVGAGVTPYCLTSDFEPYVEISKEFILRPDDERTIQPVDKVAAKTIKIAYLGGQTNPFFDAVYAGVEAAKEELAPHNVIVDWIIPGASFGTGDYGEAIETLVTKGYHGIVTMIFNEGMIPYVDSAVNQGVAVGAAIVNSLEPNKALFFIGQDLYAGGVTAAHALAEEIGEEGKVAVITGFFALYGHEQRRLGFEDTIAAEYPNIEIVGRQENLDQADKGFEQTMDFLTAHPDLAAVYNTAGGPTGAIEALIQAGRIDDVKVVCFYVPELEPYIRNNQCAAGIAQDAYAEGRDTTIRLFNYLMDGVVPPAKNLFTEMFVVTPETLDEFLASGQGA